MSLCLTFDVPIPVWALAHFFEGIGKYNNAEAKTLDDAFGVNRPKSWRQPKERARKTSGLVAHVKARYLTQGGTNQKALPVKAAIAEVAEQMNMSESTVERYYYDEQLMADLGHPQNSKKTEDES